MRYWMARTCLPGVNVPIYLAKETKPTIDDVDKAWQSEGNRPLVRENNLPLRDSYPACAGVVEIKIHAVE